ncbi:hypothetical protein KIN20_008284 [Parelaphostrongylus tenuis]|uniref:Uncharacterized protein n=1 Tax=Parelaphostrongylus tenuis TaxID=148309 RepID=A0AAD5QML8_PARTN|nr:hypothetical protein KIN20_008284 [Parelaphostrongylus tenuis]
MALQTYSLGNPSLKKIAVQSGPGTIIETVIGCTPIGAWNSPNYFPQRHFSPATRLVQSFGTPAAYVRSVGSTAMMRRSQIGGKDDVNHGFARKSQNGPHIDVSQMVLIHIVSNLDVWSIQAVKYLNESTFMVKWVMMRMPTPPTCLLWHVPKNTSTPLSLEA